MANSCKRKWRLATALVSVLCLAGCGYDPLYSDLDEQQANEMLALLLSQEIGARKARVDDAWQLELHASDLPRAMRLLRSQGFPRERFESLGDVFEKEGFVSSPLEERARLLHGLSQELSRTLSQIEGVIVARVHLAIPEKNTMSDKRKPSSASIFIKHHTSAEVATQTASIKALVVNSVEGLPYENVTVSFFPVNAPVDVAPTRVKQKLVQASWLGLGGRQQMLSAALGGGGLLIAAFALGRRQRRSSTLPRAAHEQ